MKFKAAIFDLDGTLINSLNDIADSMNIVLERHGYKTHSVDEYRNFIGGGIRVLSLRALPQNLSNDTIVDICTSEMIKEYDKRWNYKTNVYEGIRDLLEQMKQQNMLLAVLSNKPHQFTLKAVEHFFGNTLFNEVIGAGLFADKPDPEGALKIARSFDLKSSEILYIGDSAIDMKTAKSADMFACGVSWGFRPKQELEDAGADVIVEKPFQINRIIT